MRFIFLAQNDISVTLIETWVSAIVELPIEQSDVLRISRSFSYTDENPGISHFQDLSRRIHKFMGEVSWPTRRETTVAVVDNVAPNQLDLASSTSNWENIIAMLITAFPDVYWIFAETRGEKNPDFEAILTKRSISNTLYAADPLFDGDGLRSFVRARTNRTLQRIGQSIHLPIRTKRAAAIDEERAFAHYSAYTAYRFGFRSEVIHTFLGMTLNFPRNGKRHDFDVLFEDVSLNFFDLPSTELDLSQLSERAKYFESLDSTRPDLEVSRKRILVTSGSPYLMDPVVAANTQHLAYKNSFGKGMSGKVVNKPAGDMFQFWQSCEMTMGDEWWSKITGYFAGSRSNRLDSFSDFDWPPESPNRFKRLFGNFLERMASFPSTPFKEFWRRWSDNVNARPVSQHGTPGKIMAVAALLLYRARELSDTIRHNECCVMGAVFSTDALELLGPYSPSSAQEALALKHEFELAYDCQFSGAKYHLDITKRLREISSDSWHLTRWLSPERFEQSNSNTKMRIYSRLVRILRDYVRYDEERRVLSRIRHLHFSLWLREWGPNNSLRYPLLPFRFILFDLPVRYVEFLLWSFRTFLIGILFWIVLLQFGYAWAFESDQAWRSWAEAVGTFFGSNGTIFHDGVCGINEHTRKVALVNSVAIVTGAVHVGVFISYLFSLISRR